MMHPAEVFVVSFLGGVTPIALFAFGLRWFLRSAMRKLLEDAKVQCPLCKRTGALDGVDAAGLDS